MADRDDKAQAEKPHPERPKRGGWLARFAPGVRNLRKHGADTPENLWVKCPDSGEMIYRPDLEAALWVTPAGRHMRVGSTLRLRYTFDEGAWEALPAPPVQEDPLQFSDDKPYPDRLAAARKATGATDAVSIGYGTIKGVPAVAMVQDFAFMGGSLGMAAGEGFVAAAEAAVARDCPLVAFTAAGGARMQEGALSLMQMARTTIAIQRLKTAGLPYIVVLTDPTTGGVTASYAMLGDVHLAEPGALIGFAGPRVIEQTIRETLPPGFQRSEYLLEKGMVDKVVARKDLPQVLSSILQTLMMGRATRLAAPPRPGGMSDYLRAHDRVLERFKGLHKKAIDLSLDRMQRLCAVLGDPQKRLPPVVHVAGTNGKGSTIAALRAIAEAAGLSVHVFTSPHLVRFAERIRLGGRLIDDDRLTEVLDRVERLNAGAPITFFEITTAAAFLAMAEAPADLCLIEVGMGGRFDCTNVVEGVVLSVIAPVAMDHTEFLGDSLEKIAFEKAGILRPGVPAVIGRQRGEALDVIERRAAEVGAPLIEMGRDFDVWSSSGRTAVQVGDTLYDLPAPGLAGGHQVDNAGLAVAAALALRHEGFTEAVLAEGVARAAWPGRMQRLTRGPLAELAAAAGADLWLDGAHNPHGAAALADFARSLSARDGRPVTLVVGLLNNKDVAGVFEALAPAAPNIVATGFDAEAAHDPVALAAKASGAGLKADAAQNVTEAVRLALAEDGPAPHLIICGSLYLAGEVLSLSPETWPT